MNKIKLRCENIRAWNCRRIAIGYFNGELICKGCLDNKWYYVENYPNGHYDGTFTYLEDLEK